MGNFIKRNKHVSNIKVYTDVSEISRIDHGTGIQRVVRSIYKEIKSTNSEITVLPIIWNKKKFSFIFRDIEYEETPVSLCSGDIFFGLDFSLDVIFSYRKELKKLSKKGVILIFFVHDILPIKNPEWFSNETVVKFIKWISVIRDTADGFFCNSNQTMNHLIDHIENYGRPQNNQWFKTIPMGYNLPEYGEINIDFYFEKNKSKINNGFILMVGTLEPRKGYGQIVDAFDILWRKGFPINLIIVGKRGWKIEDTIKKIMCHKLYGKKLFWMTNVDDQELEFFYRECKGLISSSFDEGYGLPVTEALARGKPVLARDIEVYKERGYKGISYFNNSCTILEISEIAEKWIVNLDGNYLENKHMNTWKDSANIILVHLNNMYNFSEVKKCRQ